MNFTNKDIMKLREITGVGMMDCKRALQETNGDMDEAVKYLREKGMASAAKKASRIAAEGLVHCQVENNVAVLLEVNCETDFVARSDQFVALVEKVAAYILNHDIKDVEELLTIAQISTLVAEATAAIGEKISIRRFEKFVAGQNGVLESYIHMGGKIGVVVELQTAVSNDQVAELGHNVCMQIAAAKPDVVSVNDVDPAKLEAEREILANQARNEGKPEAIIEKMVVGRIQKYYKEVCLLEQPYVKNDEVNVKGEIARVAKAIGAEISVVRFAKYEMGQGIEKRVDTFAEEIADALKNI
ncbi:MAG: elongation factor Ts [Clostridia bacterium]|nr:elongation factor Ts [Clostridia bacterium]